ncbi:hypothetical protein [Roseateles sp.]|uniref:hypothetical protein n=1 Tax=Roseateles sp. TaxID=1971397 RepID=UPI0025EB34E3|nr:hypothetical protein [Roseateles sp.]MBV8036990.1 hypothetical protein [Roseateles sp.]
MILKPLIALVATSALAMTLLQHLGQQRRQRRARHEGRRHRDDVSRWEAEGGNLPPAGRDAGAAAPRRRVSRR